MPRIDLDILNQKQTPAFYASSLATRPAAGFVGRIFIDSDSPSTGLYRDTGTAWVSIADPGAGTTGTLEQVTTNGNTTDKGISVTANGIGIGTTVPGANLLDVHGTTGVLAQLENTTTNNSLLSFRNQGAGAWSIGNGYNAGANDFIIYDAVSFVNRFTIKGTGQTFIGSDTTSSGLLVVNSATSDNHIVCIGANAPSIRLRNTGTSPTLNAGLGISTATNNFIQGSVSGQFCIFNASTTASPILFGIYDSGAGNTVEAVRISAARNLLVGTVTDAGFKLSVSGTAKITGNVSINTTFATRTLNVGGIIGAFDTSGSTDNQLLMYNDGTKSIITSTYTSTGSYLPLTFRTSTIDRLYISTSGNVGINTTNPTQGNLVVSNSGPSTIYIAETSVGVNSFWTSSDGSIVQFGSSTNHSLLFYTNNIVRGGFSNGGNFLIGTFTSGSSKLRIVGLPTSSAGLSSGDVYNNLGILTIVP